jgi:hypothetical protein
MRVVVLLDNCIIVLLQNTHTPSVYHALNHEIRATAAADERKSDHILTDCSEAPTNVNKKIAFIPLKIISFSNFCSCNELVLELSDFWSWIPRKLLLGFIKLQFVTMNTSEIRIHCYKASNSKY